MLEIEMSQDTLTLLTRIYVGTHVTYVGAKKIVLRTAVEASPVLSSDSVQYSQKRFSSRSR